MNLIVPMNIKNRKALIMKLLPGQAEEYKKRHDEIWPELSKVLSDHGVTNYSIFLDENTDLLFGYQELEEDHTADRLAHHPIVKKWWSYMQDIMDTNEDHSPLEIPLTEMFHHE